eukprot:TRINITY_DN991_c0_g1_i1.p1 TRINITY_DN991_c0_g1~~TRINITY_DN991_c0_g1_i1.p1  ORF type:complete len:145 (+),score=43.05 TRINITY_DN991_c0_g1_i1:51-485(+)
MSTPIFRLHFPLSPFLSLSPALPQEEYALCIDDCTSSLDFNPTYLKVLRRRAIAAEKEDKPEMALEDNKRILSDIDPHDKEAKRNVQRLEPIVRKKEEEMKEEMMGKLKDLGNTLLGKFGMSVDDFQFQQDPATGSYSLSMNNK